jgi:group I intron endonuclease
VSITAKFLLDNKRTDNNFLMNDKSTRYYLVYKHTSPSGKSYIGLTNNLTKRNSKHRRDSGCIAFHTAIQKYGWNSFTHQILAENISLEEANDWEKFFIKIENTLVPNGYNLKDGGNSFTHSAETRVKIANSLKGKKASLEARAKISAAQIGKVNSAETRAKMSASQKGKKRSAEAIINISNSQKGKVSPKKGIPLSEEQKAKMSAAMKGRVSPNKGKKASEESKRKMSEAKKGNPLSDKAKEAAKIANTGRKMTEENKAKLIAISTGRKMSEESRAKMSAAQKKRFAKIK